MNYTRIDRIYNLKHQLIPHLLSIIPHIDGILTVTSSDNVAIGQLAEQNRRPFKFDQIPVSLIDALVATEDGQFWDNPGVDVAGIARSLKAGIGGGSTITQQLVKWLGWSESENNDHESFRNKDKKTAEILMAVLLEDQLEREFRSEGLNKKQATRKAKETIIEAYLNLVPFGAGIYGAKTAALSYFGTPVENLTFAQSTFLAGIPQMPSFFDPAFPKESQDIKDYLDSRLNNNNITVEQHAAIQNLPIEIQATKTRQAVVLNLMVLRGKISRDQAKNTFTEDLHLLSTEEMVKNRRLISTNEHADYFAQYIKQQLNTYLPPELQGKEMTVQTTLNPEKQAALVKTVDEYLPKIQAFKPKSVSVFVRDVKTGAILATYGDLVTLHPPGSSVKPATYAKALELGNVITSKGTVLT